MTDQRAVHQRALNLVRSFLTTRRHKSCRFNSWEIGELLGNEGLYSQSASVLWHLLTSGEICRDADAGPVDQLWAEFGLKETTTTPAPETTYPVGQYVIQAINESPAESDVAHSPEPDTSPSKQLLEWAKVVLKGNELKLLQLIVIEGVTDKRMLRDELGYDETETRVFNTLLAKVNLKIKKAKKSRNIAAFYWLDGGTPRSVILIQGDDAKLRHAN